MQKTLSLEGMRNILRDLNAQQFLALGNDQVAYIRPFGMPDGGTAYSVHAADGTTLSRVADYGTALAAVRHYALEPVVLH